MKALGCPVSDVEGEGHTADEEDPNPVIPVSLTLHEGHLNPTPSLATLHSTTQVLLHAVEYNKATQQDDKNRSVPASPFPNLTLDAARFTQITSTNAKFLFERFEAAMPRDKRTKTNLVIRNVLTRNLTMLAGQDGSN